MQLADLQTSERLIFDLYIDLRKRINFWASITHQTAQARMGYVGQHLTSIVTGFPGGKSGARGQDLILPNGQYAEIKTCYRVDQLGRCQDCNTAIASIEQECPACGSANIKRNDDSKWLISMRNDDELAQILEPKAYYLVLFEFDDLQNPQAILSSIWEVDPKVPGFAFCMVDYYYNIRAKSSSKAPFNLWPYLLKFDLMRPMLIYQSEISMSSDEINTIIFPGQDPSQLHSLKPLGEYSRSSNLKLKNINIFAQSLGINDIPFTRKSDILKYIQSQIHERGIESTLATDRLAKALYVQGIPNHVHELPEPIKYRISAMMDSS